MCKELSKSKIKKFNDQIYVYLVWKTFKEYYYQDGDK